ncbi:Seven TM Receptor [Caenorhabditis elegans]|uniref:Seven TM Receptor n=1 Tax=Caenorhabditis elegans TaxID=6239 RepID=O45806_CAEEL|nr:Seven TM Receptor [Caenorhabditis elegans]CAB04818.2 Seven TM Receptor [Caenorhabditis elegans]|eukprot:NP_506920.2 Seven TM Receptor [Caenorhabditis elegans]
MVDWFLVDQTIAQLGFYLTTTSQLVLIFLTIFYVRKDLGAYKRLIVLFAAMGIAFASIEFVMYPVLHSFNAGYVFYTTNRPLNVSNETLTVLLAVYTALYSITISLLAVQFVYRYIAVFHSEGLRFFKGWYFLLTIVYSYWFGFEWALGLYKLDEADEYAIEYMRQELMDVYQVNISQVPCVINLIYQNLPNSTDTFIRWRCVMCTLNMTFIMIVQYGVMIFCGSHLYFEMEEKLKMVSDQERKLHKQIFKTLMLQITTPTIVLFSPIIYIISVPFFNIEVSVPTGVFLSVFTLYPALDAFIIMYVITDYRKAILKILRRSGSGSVTHPTRYTTSRTDT